MLKYKQLFMDSQLRFNNLIEDINSGKFNPLNVKQQDYERYLTLQDRLVASNRFIWDFAGLTNLTSQELESIIYSRGSVAIVAHDGRLEFTDYAENGKLQIYGRLSKIKPITFSGVSYDNEQTVILPNGENAASASAIVIFDYTPPYSGRTVPRETLNRLLIGDEATVYKQMLNNIMMSIKKAIATCENLDQANAVISQAKQMLDIDSPIIAVAKKKGKNESLAEVPLDMFNFNNNFDTQNYCQQIEFYNKKRRQDMGVITPDTFEKKERKITSESEGSNLYADIMLADGYSNRLTKLNLAKKYFKNKIPGIENVSVRINPVLLSETNEVADNDYEPNDAI